MIPGINKKDKSAVKVTAIERALRVIEVLYYEGREMGVNEIAQKIGEYQSTVYRSIATLEASGYIYQNRDNNKYALGIKLYVLGRAVKEQSALIRLVEPYAQALAEEFNETVNVAVRDYSNQNGHYLSIIYQNKSKGRVLTSSEALGLQHECYYSSLGKALLAFSEDFAEKPFPGNPIQAYTPNSITSPAAFRAEIERVRELGYALDNEEQELGLFCVGCPVLNEKNVAVMAISVSGFVGNMKSIGVERIVARLREAGNELSKLVL